MQDLVWQKSSFSGDDPASNCIEMAADPGWRKSTHSGDDPASDCLEITTTPTGLTHLRESEAPTAVVTAPRAAWGAFLGRIKAGDFDTLR